MTFVAIPEYDDFIPGEHGTIVVFDLEYTAWEGSMQSQWKRPGEYREIVAIGAVKLSVSDDFREIGFLSCLVRPRINPILSDYFIELTGLTQDRLDRDGTSFADGLKRFMNFVGADVSAVFSNGGDDEVIRENSELEDIPFNPPERLFRDARPIIVAATGLEDSEVDSFRLPELFGLEQGYHAHDALDDARAVAGALRAIWGDRRGRTSAVR